MSNNNIRILSQPISYQELLAVKNLKITGIYKIENTVNHKVYIGQSRHILKRLKAHLRKEENPYLRSAFQKYGLDNFSFEVIKETWDMNYWEMFLICIYKSQDKEYGYNILPGGEGGDSEVTRQSWINPEIRCKRVESSKKVIHTPEWNRHVSESQKGKTVSEETKQKIREKRKLQAPMSEGSKQKQKESIQAYWSSPEGIKQKRINSENNKGSHTTRGKHWYNNGTVNVLAFTCPEGFTEGRLGDFSHTEEEKQRRRDWYRNLTEEQKSVHNKKAADARRGKPKSDRCRENISRANKGRRYYNNGIIEVMRFECPDGFVPGRCPSARESIRKGMKQ